MADQNSNIVAFIKDLREAREYQRISLEQVAEETHISRFYLEALEAGRWEQIPFAYLPGFLRNYADAVGMNLEKVMKRFGELNYRPPTATISEAPAPQADSVVRELREAGQGMTHAAPSGTQGKLPLDGGRQPGGPLAHDWQPTEDEHRIPTFWGVLPSWVKTLFFLPAVILAGLLIWLVLGVRSCTSDPTGHERIEETPIAEGSGTMVLSSEDDYLSHLSLTLPGAVMLFSEDSLYYNGILRADSAIDVVCDRQLTLIVERIEDLRLQINQAQQEFAPDSGRGEIRITRRGARVVRRTP